MGDSFEYIHEAVNIKDAGFFYSANPALPIDPEFMTQRQPVYPLFLLMVYLFSINNWIVLVLQNILSIFNIWYFRKGIFSLGYSHKYDPLLLLLTIAYPIQFIYANTIAPEILLQTSVLIYFRHFILLFQQKILAHAVWASVALILGLFIKPVLYPFVAVHLLLLVGWAVSNKLSWPRALAIGLLPLCAVLFYNSWNYQRTDKFHFSSNQGFNATFYYYLFLSEKEGSKKARVFLDGERQKIAAIPVYKDRYDYANDRGLALLKADFIPYTLFHLKHSLRLFVEPGKAEIDLFTGKLTYGRLYANTNTGFKATIKEKGIKGLPVYVRQNPSLLIAVIIFLFNLVRLAGLLIFFFSKKVMLSARLFVLLLCAYFAATTGPIANTHYFLPISLITIGCAIIGYMHWWDKRRNKQAIINSHA